jgi:transaldolase/transaldolase/glucose-6-phosphate isomerase
MSTNPLVTLGQLGQSPWYDYITRDLVRGGELTRLIREDGLLGMTSNPSIFEKAVSGSRLYDDDIRRLTLLGLSPKEVFEALAVTDVQGACDAFLPVYEGAGGHDGLVSLEVDPTLARDVGATVAEAERLWAAVNRPNLMIKIPGTAEGLPAITSCLARGINVNVTLLFSVTRYEQVIEAFLAGLERRLAGGGSVARLASVASFFVSRVDTKVDPVLDARGGTGHLRGSAAIANACMAYRVFERALAGARWQALAAAGARPQRPLWASTSTKDPAYPDVYYVEALIGPHTVNTLPPATFAAYRDHGQPAVRIREGMAQAPARLAALAAAGIDLDQVTETLEHEGVAAFAASYTSLLSGIEAKAGTLTGR